MGGAVRSATARSFPDPTGPFVDAVYTDPEWLFDAALHLAHQAWGLPGMVLLAALLAGGSALACWALVRAVLARPAPLACAALTLAAYTACWPRLVTRPQVLFLLFLPSCLWLCWTGFRAAGAARWTRLSLALLLLALWTQCHSSMVLAPALVAVCIPWRLLRTRRTWVLLPLGLAALLPLAGPFGPTILHQVTGHAGTEAASLILDMQPTPVAAWWPPLTHSAMGNRGLWVLEALLLLGALGALLQRRLHRGALASALLALALACTATRFEAAAAILALPLAAVALRSATLRARRWFGPLLLLLATCLAAYDIGPQHPGPGLGADPDYVPEGAAQLLESQGSQGLLFTSYAAGGYLGWRLQGQARVYIDGRTPTHFDAQHLHSYLQALQEPAAFMRMHRALGFSAALVPRGTPLCQGLAQGWSPVWAGQRDVLFLPQTPAEPDPAACAAPLEALEACLARSDRAQRLARIDAILAQAPASHHMARLGALLALECGAPDPDRAASYLEQAALAHPDSPQLPWLRGLLAIRQGRARDALEQLDHAERTNPSVASARLQILLASGLADEAAQEAAWLVQQLGMDTPPLVHALHAQACEATEDLDCAAQAHLRAYLGGRIASGEALRQLLENGQLQGEEARLTRALLGE